MQQLIELRELPTDFQGWNTEAFTKTIRTRFPGMGVIRIAKLLGVNRHTLESWMGKGRQCVPQAGSVALVAYQLRVDPIIEGWMRVS